jgi:surface antigen
MAHLTGCSNLDNQDIGVITGGVAGGLVGSTIGGGSGRIIATGIGAIAGAYIGGAIGRNMDKTDQLETQMALEKSASGHPTTWKNPDTGNRYTVTPRKTVVGRNHQPCREYMMTAMIAGKKQQMYGTACRQADGSWKNSN